jgi:5-methylcytosine-specific restriction endonuclease McrA
VFEPLDSTRNFSITQRRILWHASGDRRCAICRKPVKRWEDVSIDHVTAYIKGGVTDLSNAALTHRTCNSGKGAA